MNKRTIGLEVTDMKIAEIYVNGVTAVASRVKKIPKGIIGATVKVTFANEWADLAKTAVFQGVVTKDVLVDGNSITIPAECVDKSGYRLRVGFYGVADETLAIPTIWTELGTIRDATDPSGDTSTDPTLPVWAQLQDQVDNMTAHTDEQIQEAIDKYLEENPGGNVDLTGYATEQWVKDYAQPKGEYLKSSELSNAVNTALAEAKASGEFNGKDGIDGADGKDGKDGTSVTVKSVSESAADGGSNVVTFSDGKTVTIRNGSKGSTGATGADGYTPVRGTDYWTEADKQEILAELIAEQTGTVAIPLTELGYMEGGNGWNQLNTAKEGARNSGYVEIPEGYTHIKAILAINKYGWAVLFATGNGTGLILDSTVSALGGETAALAEYFVEIPTNAKYVMVSTFTSADSSSAYFTNAENESDTEETPADILDGTEFSLFRQWGIVGDSLSVGHTADSDGNASSPNLYYSWGQYLARRIGNTCLNFGRSGVSAKEWMTDDKGYNLLIQPEQLCQCYILALGANDADYTLGSIADVDFSNMDNNADTEYGWYARVINAIRTTAPQAPIFLFTMPYPRNDVAEIKAINNMIREFASNENFSMVYLVDLDADYNDYFKEGKLGNCIGNTGWHLTALGYLYASVVNEVAISKVMAENAADFQNVFEIPYGTAETDTPTTETWVFTLEDGSTVSKDVMIG